MKPRMLQLLRESRGLSQTALSKLSAVPQPTLSKVENGIGELDGERAQAVADALKYPLEAFDWPDEIFGFGSAAFHHRKQQALGTTTLQRIHADVNLVRMRASRLLRGVEMSPRFPFPNFDVDEYGSPEEVARAVRAAWRLPMGPVENMMRVLENAGAIVVRADLYSHRISAISTSVPETPPLFILNQGMSADRERFTLAHELGHLVMHDIPAEAENAEREADAFASEFLMPASEIWPQLLHMDLAKAAQLKRHWKTAMSAIIRRARDLGRIDERRYKSLNVQISQKGWRKIEPVEIEHEQPTLIPQIIALHHGQHQYAVGELARLTGLFDEEYVERFNDYPQGGGLKLVGSVSDKRGSAS